MGETLEALAMRCEKAGEPDRRIDRDIWRIVENVKSLAHDEENIRMTEARRGHLFLSHIPPFTASLDAAMTLVPPSDRWPWNITMATFYGSASVIPCHGGSYGINDPHAGHGRAATPALALCAAALRARAMVDGKGA